MGTVEVKADTRGQNEGPELITLKAACERYSISYDYLHRAVLERRIPALRPSRQWLVEPGDVRTLIVRDTEERAS